MTSSTLTMGLVATVSMLFLADVCAVYHNPLFLTPYLKDGRLKEAQQDSYVSNNLSSAIRGFAAYLTVNDTYDTNLFFWFLPAEVDMQKAPLLLWLDGGPGSSSMTGVFVLTGPYVVDDKGKMTVRRERWTRRYNMLYIDNPAGVGFSFTKQEAGYARNEDDVARDLYAFLVQFVQIFFQLKNNPLYLGGLSYAGKYVPALGYRIHTQNPTAAVKLNLQGIYIGGPFTDPKTILPTYATHLYNTGLLSWPQSNTMATGMGQVLTFMDQGRYQEAYNQYEDYYLGTGFLYKSSGYEAHANILEATIPASETSFVGFVSSPSMRASLHAGDYPFNDSSAKVFQLLEPDFLQSVLPWLATLMDNYRVLLFNGQLDMIVCPPSTQATLRATSWSGKAEYLAAARHVWRMGGNDSEVAGWVTQVRNFTHVVVRGAGHMTPLDQPERTWDMVQRFIDQRPFF